LEVAHTRVRAWEVSVSDSESQARSMPTLMEVALRAGVSKATASRVLADSPTPVDPETASRVRLAARDLNYLPNPHARALARSTSPSVGLLIHEISNPFFSEIASGVLAAAERHDRMVMICNTRRDPDQELRYVKEMRVMRAHALIIAGSGFTDSGYEALLEQELAAYRAVGGRVALLRRHPSGAVVIPDTSRGAHLVADHLLARGHTEIGVVTGRPQLVAIQERLVAFRERLESAGVELTSQHSGGFSREGGREATLTMLETHPNITAIFALNDLMAVGAIHAVHELGLRVPEDVSVVGFSDVPVASDTSPPLTTLRLPLREMGEVALETALSDEQATERTLVLGVELIDRGSTGQARPNHRVADLGEERG
jgi:LacI family transcriptional regulator